MNQSIHFCTASDGVRIAYAKSGRGPPLVKAANWFSHLDFEWNDPVVSGYRGEKELSQYFTLVRYDGRGSGLSDWEVPDLSFEAWVRDLEAVVDAAGLDRFPLLGICQGGAVAVAYAARHPERVSHLILYGAFHCGSLLEPDPIHIGGRRETFDRLLQLGWGKHNSAFLQVFSNLMMPEATVEQVRALTEVQRRSTSMENARRILHEFSKFNVQEPAGQVQAPTLVLHARGDTTVPFEAGRKMASLIPGARFVPLESKNHCLLEHEPGRARFVEEVRNFVGAPTEAGDSAQRILLELTEREREVLDAIARGWDNARIAERLFISPKTLGNHISHIFRKLGVTTRAEAIVRARETGFAAEKRPV